MKERLRLLFVVIVVVLSVNQSLGTYIFSKNEQTFAQYVKH